MNLPLRRNWRLLSHYLWPRWPQVLLMGLLLGIAITLQLAGPQIQRAFIDTALAGGETDTLVGAALLFIAVAVAAQLVGVLDGYVAESTGWAATNALRADVALHCLRLDASFHHAHTPGELIERIDGDVTVLATFFSRLVVHVLGNALLLVGVLVLLTRESWLVGAAAGGFALVVLLAMLRLYARAQPIWAAVQQAQALFYGFIAEHLTGAEDLRANGAVPYVERRFDEHVRAWLPLTLRAVMAEQVVWMVALSLFAAAEAVALGLGYSLLRGGVISAGTVFLLYRYVVLLSRPVGQIQAQIQNLQQAGAAIGRIEQLLATRSRIEQHPATRLRTGLPTGALSVELNRVTFAYPQPDGGRQTKGGGVALPAPLSHLSSPLALDGVSLHLNPGRTLGVLGRTGSGKSTLARLLVRAYDATAGSVRVGGTDVRDVAITDLRERIGVVTQEVQLFQASVRDNLTLFDHAVPDARLLDAIDTLGLTAWLQALPGGLNTQLGPSGSGLSGGQAQLLAFVRVFLKDPGLVILDEASSRLDPLTERLIEGAVDRLLHGRTAVVIAHRLATLRRAEYVLVLESGRIVEHGPRAALAADPTSRLAALLHAGNQPAPGTELLS
ncbi:MAG: Heterodimeric efflux ABC transporter, permease/ATP-binding subunit 1 [uncultured Chloroflexi bacterium]|uniref:Heterodimeric efflux ABC transporter, permease/ATP-binding subunit 1 n=1 Tax=uncultured Chloroflexota bacterium TaxID=166587 RepID=A0A6J4J3M4_9CHLR|nr:MAG: Heterodimeric efflux ABC transporter, permease/ATP-binding subunit 1 [uncultured Chloroflexota bacterium]